MGKIEKIPPWRGGRAVEGAALEMLFRGDSDEGSNPSLSVFFKVEAALITGLPQTSNTQRQDQYLRDTSKSCS